MLEKNYSGFVLETGTDEAGRGCLAGPVTAAAIILPADFENILLNDSKFETQNVKNMQPKRIIRARFHTELSSLAAI